MKKRSRMSRSGSKKNFKKGLNVNRKNIATTSRGGIRF